MKVGWIGLGKLGLPCALALEKYGQHSIVAYDTNPRVAQVIADRGTSTLSREEGVHDLLAGTELQLVNSISSVVAETDDFIFVSVQTPHGAAYGGEQPMPQQTQDFDYTHLREVASTVNSAAEALDKHVTMIVISTALPGTMREQILPLINESFITLVYNPFFIAMGTTVRDFLNPEFVLLGCEGDCTDVEEFYENFYYNTGFVNVDVLTMSLEEAELVKVSYNTFISMKVVFANTLAEICHKIGANVDVITDALGHATRRVVSTAYMSGGMGDGGACHPRDNIAMSWLAQKLDLACDPFAFVTQARESHSQWLASLIAIEAKQGARLPIVVLGKAYKPGSDLTFGSPALLLIHHLNARGFTPVVWDPYVDANEPAPDYPAIYFIATKHELFRKMTYPKGSVIIDPHRYFEPGMSDVRVIPIGGEFHE